MIQILSRLKAVRTNDRSPMPRKIFLNNTFFVSSFGNLIYDCILLNLNEYLYLVWNSSGYLTHRNLTMAIDRWEVWKMQTRNLQNTIQHEQQVVGNRKEGGTPSSLKQQSTTLPTVKRIPQRVWILINLFTMVSHCPVLNHTQRRQRFMGT